MYYGMYLSAAGANAQSAKMEVIGNNIANVGTAGFKRQLAVLQARAAEEVERGLMPPGQGGIEDIGGGVTVSQTVTDYRLGPMRTTGEDTDFALDQPDSFFVVEKDGEEFLTRTGNFHFNSRGELITDQGYNVLAADGGPITVDPNLPFTVTPGGVIEQAGDQRPLALQRPASLGDLLQQGENLYRSIGSPPSAVEPNERSVRWKHLEMSAVQPQEEMVAMIETSRAYEANVRMIQNHDSLLNSLFSRVLRSN